MLSVEMFCILVLLDVILFLAGLSERGNQVEKIVLILVSSVLSFLLSLECFAGITSSSGTVVNQWIGMFFAVFGALMFIFFIKNLLATLNEILEKDPDYFNRLG